MQKKLNEKEYVSVFESKLKSKIDEEFARFTKMNEIRHYVFAKIANTKLIEEISSEFERKLADIIAINGDLDSFIPKAIAESLNEVSFRHQDSYQGLLLLIRPELKTVQVGQ